MKNKIDISLVVEKRGLWAALLMILAGGVATIFFGLALIGFSISPNLLGNLPSAIVTALFFAGSVLLLRRGIRRLKAYRSGRQWAGEGGRARRTSPTPQTPPPPPKTTADVVDVVDMPDGGGVTRVQGPDASLRGDGHVVVKMKCQSCGAFCAPDGQGRCEYCGVVLK